MKRKLFFLFLISILPAFMSSRQSAEPTSPRETFTGFRPLPLFITNEAADIDITEKIKPTVDAFIRRWEIAGLSMAVANQSKIVYARGFGYADLSGRVETEPFHEFRIASVSKLITATAVFKLVEEGKLSLEDHVFGKDGILNDSLYMHPRDPRVFRIKVKHLLEHSGGWTTRYGDQMFMTREVARQLKTDPPVPLEKLIGWVLTKRLHFTPGTRSVYSNLGYSILGLVVQRASGMPYTDYVQTHLFNPIGIAGIQPGKNLKDQKKELEVNYYEPSDAYQVVSIYDSSRYVPRSYGGNDIETLGAAGSWIASAPDLLRFVLGIDGDNSFPDIIDKTSFSQMTCRKKGFSPMGWRGTRKDGTLWRTGSFAGTCAMVKKMPNGLVWVVLVNSNTWKGPGFENDINNLMTRLTSRIKNWPDTDLFENYAGSQTLSDFPKP